MSEEKATPLSGAPQGFRAAGGGDGHLGKGRPLREMEREGSARGALSRETGQKTDIAAALTGLNAAAHDFLRSRPVDYRPVFAGLIFAKICRTSPTS